LGARDSKRTTCGFCRRSSAASSMVTIRSAFGMTPESALSRVVFPDPVPPATTMLRRDSTASRKKSRMGSVMAPMRVRSSSVHCLAENFRIVSAAPSNVSGGKTIFTREPSARRASQMGMLSSTRRPKGVTMRSITVLRSVSAAKARSVVSNFPRRSTMTGWQPVTMISETDGSFSSGSIGPRPSTSAMTRVTSCSRSSLVPPSFSSRAMAFSTVRRAASVSSALARRPEPEGFMLD